MSIGWSLSGARPIAGRMKDMRRRAKYPKRAFNKMLDEVANRQTEWFNSQGAADGYSQWAARRGRYAAYMEKHYPGRPILVGPDRKSRKGGRLRKELTTRPFGIEKIHARGFTYGTELPYAEVHQKGLNELPRRRPLRPVDAKTREKFLAIMARHVTVSQKSYAAGKRP